MTVPYSAPNVAGASRALPPRPVCRRSSGAPATPTLAAVERETSGGGALGFWSAASIGIGGMVGGGIFAVLGLAVRLARGGTPAAFALAGAVALAAAYSYARLSVAFPSEGGTVTFLNRAYGAGRVTGTLNVLLWISYTVMLALYAYAFGSYGASFFSAAARPLARHLLITGVIVLLSVLNAAGAKRVGEAENVIVAVKLAILLFFVAVGMGGVSWARLAPAAWAGPVQLAAGGMIIFLAYEGFELIANTAADVRSPQTTLPRALFASVAFVIVLYILVSVVAVGSLAPDRIAAAQDYALAEAARPRLGQAGFTLIAAAALLSTASAINATLYGASRVSYIIAKDGELPAVLERRIWRQPLEGLVLTAAVTIAVANLFDLSSISTMGSAGFLLIFAAVCGASWRLYREAASSRALSALGVVLCLAALTALVWQVARTAPARLWALAAMLALAAAIEVGYRAATGRTVRVRLARGAGGGSRAA